MYLDKFLTALSTLFVFYGFISIFNPEKKETSNYQYQVAGYHPQIDTIQRFLEFPNNNKTLLYPFLESLRTSGKSDKTIRILHYGDSQIEADRISGYLRYRFQSQFGGFGAGLLPVKQDHGYDIPMVIKTSHGWKRQGVIGITRDTIIPHRRYGILASFCRFSPVKTDSVIVGSKTIPYKRDSIDETTNFQEWVFFGNSKYSYKNVKNYKQCQMFYGYNKSDVVVKMLQDSVLTKVDTLKASGALNSIKWEFDKTPENLVFQFEGKESPDIFCFAFDGKNGVAVDNIPIRGCSGTIFTMFNKDFTKQMYNELNVKLIVYQFGGNTVPYLKVNDKWYGQVVLSQLLWLKRQFPNIPVIVIGVQDMAKKENKEFVSYSNIEYIRDEMKSACFKAGCIYWDMYEAMGGKNSIIKWVNNKPPLGEKDYTHFTPNGSNLIARLFHNALMSEYNEYLNKLKK